MGVYSWILCRELCVRRFPPKLLTTTDVLQGKWKKSWLTRRYNSVSVIVIFNNLSLKRKTLLYVNMAVNILFDFLWKSSFVPVLLSTSHSSSRLSGETAKTWTCRQTHRHILKKVRWRLLEALQSQSITCKLVWSTRGDSFPFTIRRPGGSRPWPWSTVTPEALYLHFPPVVLKSCTVLLLWAYKSNHHSYLLSSN